MIDFQNKSICNFQIRKRLKKFRFPFEKHHFEMFLKKMKKMALNTRTTTF